MSLQQVRISPYYAAIRSVAHETGKLILEERRRFGQSTVGIWKWTDETLKAIERLRSLGLWRWDVPDIETVRRRIAYLASAEWMDEGLPRDADSPPMWEHLSCKYADVDPRTGHVRLQSSYRMKEAL